MMLSRFLMVVLWTCILTASGIAFADTVNRPELNRKAVIYTNSDGILTIRARNAHDLYFLQGYVHGRDRLFQLDLNRRQPSGTLAELFGPPALAGDVEARTLGLRRAAERSLDALTGRTVRAIEAYAEGLNTWVAENPLPPEYGLLGITSFEPWTPVDTLVVGKALAFRLSFSLDTGNTERFAAYLGTLGPQGQVLFTEDVFRAQPFDCASTVPDATGAPPFIPGPGGDTRCTGGGAAPTGEVAEVAAAASQERGGFDVAALQQFVRTTESKLRRSSFIAEALDTDEPNGSNEWGVTGAFGNNGVPIMANDPHLSLDVPSTFYPVNHIRPGVHVYGSSVPGTPFIVQGTSLSIAWGSTVNPMDVTDVFLELVSFDRDTGLPAATIFQGKPEPIEVIPEVFRFNAGGGLATAPPGPCNLPGCNGAVIPPATFVVPRRNNGPLVSFFNDQADDRTGLVPALSIQYTGFSATRELDTFRLWNEARNLRQFINGLSYFDVGSQNWSYTDARGNLAYFTSAELPLRSDLQAGTVAPGQVPGFFPPGVPIPPWFVRDGTSGAHEWLPLSNPQRNQSVQYEILPFEEMPQLLNPSAGYFINANNDPAGTVLDNNPVNQLRLGGDGIYYLNAGYAGGFRAGTIARRLTEVLEEKGEASAADLQSIQADVSLLDARYFAPLILAAWEHAGADGAGPELAALTADPGMAEAIGRLADWDYTTPTGIQQGYDAGDDPDNLPAPSETEIANSVAATIYSVWRGQAVRAIIDRTLSDLGLPGPGSTQAMTAMRNLFDNFESRQGRGASGIDFFVLDGVEDAGQRRDIIVLTALRSALDLLAGEAFAPVFAGSTDQNSYRWGYLHRLVLDHPFVPAFSIPPQLGDFPPPLGAIPGLPTDGGFNAVDASSHSARADDWTEFSFGSGPNRRVVVEYAFPLGVKAKSIWPGGVSGVPAAGNPFYSNLLRLWLVNDTIDLEFIPPSLSANDGTIFTP